MQGTFVVRLAIQTNPSEGHFEGWVEEVDSALERRFYSTTELLEFLGQRFIAVFGSAGHPDA